MKSLSPLLFYSTVPEKYHFDKEIVLSNKNVYGYEVCEEELCCGLLVSKTMLDAVANLVDCGKYFMVNRKSCKTKKYRNIRNFLHLKDKPNYVVLADPGTWSYVNCLKLPEFLFDQDLLFKYYNSLRFDLCGSVDWPIVDKVRVRDGESGRITFRELSLSEKEYRRDLTIELAKKFIKKCRSMSKINFIPFGTAQGYNISTYVNSLRKILKMGYSYVAIGGLPSSSEKQVLELLPELTKCIRKHGRDDNIGMHLYGRFPSPKAVRLFAEAGVTSFDNNSSYITASQTKCTFFHPNFKTDRSLSISNPDCYNIKIPSKRGKSIALFKRKAKDEDQFSKALRVADRGFKSFVRYNKDQSNVNRRKFLKMYQKMYYFFRKYGVVKISDNAAERIIKVANDSLCKRLWKKCGCTACKIAQAHIMLMRGNPRIPYTFFHNTIVQHERFRLECSDKLVKKYINKYSWKAVYKKRDLNVKNMWKG